MDFIIIAALVVLIVIVGAWRAQRRIARNQQLAQEWLADGAIVVDARSAAEFSGGHHPGAINLPPRTWVGDLTRHGPLDRPMVIYCASGGRSRQLAARLVEAGFTRVLDVGTARALQGLPTTPGEDS